MGLITWYTNALFAMHQDCKGHSGAMMTFGEGAFTSFSCILNPKRSTEAELVGLNGALPQIQ